VPLERVAVGRSVLIEGALLLDLWFDQPYRPTRDIDLLGFGSSEIDDLIEVVQTAVPNVAPLGLSDAFTGSPIKQQQWQAFRSKSKLTAPGLAEVAAVLRRLLGLPGSGAAR
jgi:hypothetical protein